VLLETGRVGRPGDSPARRATRNTDFPTHVTIPLDAITDDPRELHLAARSIASDLLADYGTPTQRLQLIDAAPGELARCGACHPMPFRPDRKPVSVDGPADNRPAVGYVSGGLGRDSSWSSWPCH
jgi:hypothetical protein